MAEIVKLLDKSARKHAGENFRTTENSPVPNQVKDEVKDPDFVVELQDFHNLLDRAMEKFDGSEGSKVDAFLAQEITDALDFDSRRQAANPEVWDYLSVVERPDFVRWRWPEGKRKHFFAKSLKNHVFARVYWSARLAEEAGDEDLVGRLFADTDLWREFRERSFSRCEELRKPFIESFTEITETEEGMEFSRSSELPNRIWRSASEELNKELTTILAEDLEEREFKERIKQAINS